MELRSRLQFNGLETKISLGKISGPYRLEEAGHHRGGKLKTKFDWRAAYFNVVSLVAVIVFLAAANGAGHGVLRLIFPTLSMNQDDWQQVKDRRRATTRAVGSAAGTGDTGHRAAGVLVASPGC